jgi:hypothetical protein
VKFPITYLILVKDRCPQAGQSAGAEHRVRRYRGTDVLYWRELLVGLGCWFLYRRGTAGLWRTYEEPAPAICVEDCFSLEDGSWAADSGARATSTSCKQPNDPVLLSRLTVVLGL